MDQNGKAAVRRAARHVVNEIPEKIGGGRFVFRGEPARYEKCSSSLYRRMPDEMRRSREAPALQRIYRDLIIEGAAKHVDFREEEDILAKVRRCGGFTNLIDFTGSYLVALFFACRGNPEEDGRLILLPEAHGGNEYAVCSPQIKDSRLPAQSGVFVDAPKGYLDDEDMEIMLIRHEDKKGIMDHLSRHCGISERSLFNDLHGFIGSQEEILKTVPFFNKGLQAMKRRDWKEGIEQFTQVIDMHPGFYLAYYNRGLNYSNMGNVERAAADYSKAIELYPEYTEAYSNRGLAYSSMGDDERAVADYSKVIELDPGHAEAYSNRGLAYSSMGDDERAVADYSRAIELDPRHAEAYYNRGSAYSSTGDNEQAVADYSRAIELDPGYAEAYYNRGRACHLLGRHEEAKADYDQCECLAQEQNLGNLLNKVRNMKRQLK